MIMGMITPLVNDINTPVYMITILLHGNDLHTSPLRVRPCLINVNFHDKYVKSPHVSACILIEGGCTSWGAPIIE